MTTDGSTLAGRHVSRTALAAFAWGLAEATFFFIVPDVYLTRVALRSLRRALIGCGFALGGALIGGTGLWFAARQGHAPVLLHAYLWVPGINNNVIATAGQSVQRDGPAAMFQGAVSGRPYKLYAVHSGAQDVPFGDFIGVSALARMGRFTVMSLFAWVVGLALRRVPDEIVFRLHLLFWAVFYTIYFVVMR